MEVVGRLLEANGELAAAERGFQLPTVRHAEVEVRRGMGRRRGWRHTRRLPAAHCAARGTDCEAKQRT